MDMAPVQPIVTCPGFSDLDKPPPGNVLHMRAAVWLASAPGRGTPKSLVTKMLTTIRATNPRYQLPLTLSIGPALDVFVCRQLGVWNRSSCFMWRWASFLACAFFSRAIPRFLPVRLLATYS